MHRTMLLTGIKERDMTENDLVLSSSEFFLLQFLFKSGFLFYPVCIKRYNTSIFRMFVFFVFTRI